MTAPIKIWALSDHRAGIENQVMGLAEAVAGLIPAEITRKRLRFKPMFAWLPTELMRHPDALLAKDSDRMVAPYPDIFIAAGRASLPFSLRMKQRSGNATLVVQLQHPRETLTAFDLVIAPEHDGLAGTNVLTVTGSTNRVTSERLAREAPRWSRQVADLPHPRVAVLIGGKSKTHHLSAQRARQLADQIRAAVGTGSLLLTLSRRTPPQARQVLIDRLGDLPGILYDGEGENPYFAFLHYADHILVTEDSVNMTTEAAVTGRPVYRLDMDRRRPEGKFARFHQSLERQGIVRPFAGRLEDWTYRPLNETERAAHEVLRVFNEKRSRPNP